MLERRRTNPGLRWIAAALLAALATGPLKAAEARWTSLGPPAAPPSSRLVLETGRGEPVYALTTAGLWRSSNGGSSWSSLQSQAGGVPVALAPDPLHSGRLYASVFDNSGNVSIRRSDDFGSRWSTTFQAGYISPYETQDLRVDPVVPDTLYWSANERLLRSRDGGRTWEAFPQESQGLALSFALPADRPGTIYVVGVYEMWISRDSGQTWTRKSSSMESHPPDTLVTTRSPRTLYGWWRDPYVRGNNEPCFLRSDDEGETWKAFLHNTKCGAPAIDPDDPLLVRIVVPAAQGGELRVSKDGGETWASAGAVPDVGDLYRTPGGGFMLATPQGLFRSQDEGGPWRPANRGFTASQVKAFLPTEEGLLAAPALPDVSPKPPAVPLLATLDEGRTWDGLPLRNAMALAVDPSDPRHLLASAVRWEENWAAMHHRVLESRDGGRTWRGVVDPQIDPPQLELLAIDPFDARILYGGTVFKGFQRSDDGGRTWSALNTGLKLRGCAHYYCNTNRVSAILPDPEKPGRVVILYEGKVYSSEDGGRGWWLPIGPQLPPRTTKVAALTRDPEGALVALVAGVHGDDGSPGAVYRSANNGATWQRVGRLPKTALGRLPQVTGLVATRTGLFVSTDQTGVFESRDGGRTWKALSQGLPRLDVTGLAADPSNPSRLYATIPLNGVYAIDIR